MPSLAQSERLVAQLVRDAGGTVVGRTRLQKLAYLLERAGLGSGFTFEYKFYGPYSEELAEAAERAASLGLVQEEEKVASWGGRYSIFSSELPASKAADTARRLIARIAAQADAVELELAATAAFLASEFDDPWEETARRKPQKAEGRLPKAKALYRKFLDVKAPRSLPKI